MSIVDVTNDLTHAQRQRLSDKLELLMRKYGTMSKRESPYYEGIADGLNIAYKLINEIDDDYNEGEI